MRFAYGLASAILVGWYAFSATGGLLPSANARYLVDENGKPFLITGDSAWSLFAQLDLQEAELYLEDRAERGFNVVVASLLEHKFTSNPPANAAGNAPFTGRPFATPNEAYFAHADAVVTLAAERDIVILLGPVYLGWGCSDQGWCAEVQSATLAEMRDWGRYVGNRYAAFDNIIWSMGGDADPTAVADKLRAVVQGLREFDSTHLITAHNHRGTQAVTYWPNESWLQINNAFPYRDALYQYTQFAYDHAPAMPFFLLEGFYENEYGATAKQLRAQSYWTVLTGGCGVVFGNCPLWHFGYSSSWCGLTDWQAQLARPGSVQMTHYRALFESRRWEQLVPDTDGSVLTSGSGTWGTEDFATAAAAADGSSIIAYVPTARSLSFDTTVLSGNTVRAWWFHPGNASTTLIGDFPSGNVSISPPPAGDWVLVLDDAALDFPAPGTPLPTDAPAASMQNARLEAIQPNPFNPKTEIHYELTQAMRVQISIFDASGRCVRRLLDRVESAGSHVVGWDGRDEEGRSLGSGMYVCHLGTAAGNVGRKMILLK